MSQTLSALIGAILGFAYRAYQYIGAIPDGAAIDTSGLLGFGLSGALIGAIIGAVVGMIIRLVRRKA